MRGAHLPPSAVLRQVLRDSERNLQIQLHLFTKVHEGVKQKLGLSVGAFGGAVWLFLVGLPQPLPTTATSIFLAAGVVNAWAMYGLVELSTGASDAAPLMAGPDQDWLASRLARPSWTERLHLASSIDACTRAHANNQATLLNDHRRIRRSTRFFIAAVVGYGLALILIVGERI